MSVRLDVPFLTQYDQWGNGQNNCGPAGIAMLLAARGAIPATYEAMLECADLARDGISNDVGESGGYTTFAQLAYVASWYGCETVALYAWEQVKASLDAGEGVVLLVDNTVLAPREYPVSPAFNAHHFIVLTGYVSEQGVAPTNDPLAVDYTPGDYYYWSVQQGATNVGGVQGLALVPLARPEEGIPMDTTPEERQALKPYFDQLGQDCNMDTTLMMRACLAYKRGESRGPALTGEYPAVAPSGRPSVRQNFTASICEAFQREDGSWEANWVELVLHPEGAG